MKPMLASPVGPVINFPVMASPKLDGIRCLIIDGMPVSRSLKPIRNEHIRALLGHQMFNGLDGELVVGDPWAKDCMQVTSSGVMSSDGEPDFTFHVFDLHDCPDHVPFATRLIRVLSQVQCAAHARVKMVPHVRIEGEAKLREYEAACLALGYEGVMLRDPNGPYKFGRSTAKEGWLLKLKRFEDSEATVIGVEEEMHNANEATKDALGHTERSTHKAGMVGKGRLGALVCRTPEGVEFNIGSGFTAAQRETFWALWQYNQKELIGSTVKYKHFAAGGVVEAPRFPVFLGFRDPEDMS